MPLRTFTAPTATRIVRASLRRSKSTNRSSVARSGFVSYQLTLPGVACPPRNGGGWRGWKKPAWPSVIARQAARPLMPLSHAVGHATASNHGSAGTSGHSGERQIASQNSRSRSTRRSGALPAMIAAFNAPIEMPASRFGCRPASSSASNTPAW